MNMSHLSGISSMNTGTYTETAHQANWKATQKPPQENISRVSPRWGVKGKEESGTKKKINEDGQSGHNSFKILEEEVGNNRANQELETNTMEKDRDASMEDIPQNNQQKDVLKIATRNAKNRSAKNGTTINSISGYIPILVSC